MWYLSTKQPQDREEEKIASSYNSNHVEPPNSKSINTPIRRLQQRSSVGIERGSNDNKTRKLSRFQQIVHSSTTTNNEDVLGRRSSPAIERQKKQQEQGTGKEKMDMTTNSNDTKNSNKFDGTRSSTSDQALSYDRDRMWRRPVHTQSIEELEARLTARWGTEMSMNKPTAKGTRSDSSEEADDDEEDTEDEDYVGVRKSSSIQRSGRPQQSVEATSMFGPTATFTTTTSSRSSKSSSDGRTIRSRPVRVPGWQEDDIPEEMKTSTTSSKNNGYSNPNDKRKRQNQRFVDTNNDNSSLSLQQKQAINGKNSRQTTKSSIRSTSTTTSSAAERQYMGVNHLIQPRPVGGRGSNEDPTNLDGPKSKRMDGSSGSFFFVAPPTKQQESSIHDERTQQVQVRSSSSYNSIRTSEDTSTNKKSMETTVFSQPITPSPASSNSSSTTVPIRDSSGQPILLTLKQAQRSYQQQQQMLSIGDGTSANDMIYEKASTSSGTTVTNSTSTTTTSSTLTTWQELLITHPLLLRNLQSMGCHNPLSVQIRACAPILSGNDSLVGTYTGSGKTLAFLVPLAQRILTMMSSPPLPINSSSTIGTTESPPPPIPGNSVVQVFILAPSRELASQIVDVCRQLLAGTGITTMLAIGGTTYGRNLEQIRQRKPTVLVGTPGRMAELIVGKPNEKSGPLKVNHIQAILVLDEFDALVQYDAHRGPTRAIVSYMQQRLRKDGLQSILCSATASDLMAESSLTSSSNVNNPSSKLQQFLRPGFVPVMTDDNDVFVTSLTAGIANDLEESAGISSPPRSALRMSRTVLHGVVHVPHKKLALETLRRILNTEPLPQQVLVFVEDARRVEITTELLGDMGIIAAPFHGGVRGDKTDRAEVSRALREGYVGLVVATELAARGIDAPLLTHVINMDLPTDASHYAHRAGRCGRGGRPGVVINLTTSPAERKVPDKFAQRLGITMHTVDVRNGKLNIVDPSSIEM